MSTKMNFGPEWMRSAPAQAKPATNGSSTGAIATAAANAGANGYASANPPDRAVDSDAPPEPRRYTQEMMLQLFKPQDLTHDFVASEHVFSGPSLPPVSLTALTAKEQELLAGSINSGPSKRYNANNQQQHQHQQHYSRSNAASLQRSGSYGPMTTAARAKYKDEHSHAAAGLDNDPAADAEESLWAHQSLARDSVGSFGADGVFRMGAANDDDALEGPVSRSSTRGDALRDPDGFTSRSGSPATASSRIGAAAGLLSRTHSHSHSHSRAHQRLSDTRSPHASSALDVGASAVTWNDLATRPPGFLQQQQQQTQNRLVKRAELVKWWYRDPQGNIQGPFSVANMQDWYSGDYFPTDLHVCHEGGPGFEPLGSLVARIGDDQNVFLYASLAFIAQGLQQRGSGISTPATPGTISRAASAVQVATLSTEVASVVAPAVAPAMPNIGIGALSGGSQGSPATGIDGTSASLTASSGADLQQTGSLPVAEQPGTAGTSSATDASPSASGPPSQAVQLSILLNEQLLLVSAISDRQRNILSLQEQLQQNQNKLMQELSHESSAIHYRAQLEHLPVQHELLYALQQRAQVAEERLRLEFTQLIQVQAAQISQLEASIDPVIKDIVLRNGTAFALSFIGQQLQDLSNQAASEPTAQLFDSTQPTSAAEITADAPSVEPKASAAEPIPAADVVKSPTKTQGETAERPTIDDTAKTAKQKSQQSATANVSDIQTKLASVDISSEAVLPTLSKSESADKSAGLSKASVGASTKPQATTSAPELAKSVASTKTKPVAQAAASVPEKATSAAGKANPAVVSPKVVSVSAANPAPWSTSAKPKQPKKSLLQIQQEEEEAMKKRQQAEEQLRSQAPMARSFTGSYADRLGGTSSISSAPRSLASIMEEQSKEGVKNASIASPLTSNSATSSRPDGPRTLTLAEAAAPAPPALASQSSRTGTAASPSTTTSAWGSVSSPAASFAMSAAAAAAAAGGSASGSVGSTSASSSGFTSVPATSTNATAPKSHGVKKPSSVLSSVATTSSSATSKNVSAASIVSTTTISAMPSMKFLEWCYSRLGSLRGIDITKFIEVLLTFPMQQSESTLEIIAEQIYAYSPTLNGRAFAEDFMTRRRKDFSSVRGGSLKSAPPNWMQILNSSASAKPSSQSMSQSGSDFVRVASSGASRGNSADSSFQVVGNKKGRRG